jgi:CubicO group peptidase (beta-lactamase class C family)
MRSKIPIIVGRVLLWIFLAIGGIAAAAYWKGRSVPRGDPSAIENHLSQKLTDAVSDQRLGCGALVLIQNGKIVAERGFGITNVETEMPVSTDQTLFIVASVSKAVTAWGIMKLVEDGKLGLDEPVMTHLKRWRFPGSERYRDKVTVRHLLSHTAGIDDGFGYRGFSPGEPAQTLEESLTLTKDVTSGSPRGVIITREPGTAMSYSGASYTILQLLIEEVTGQTFNSYMKETVLQPLRMTKSAFDLEVISSEGHLQDLAASYDHELRPQPHRFYTAKASVSLHTTPHDLGRFVAAYTEGNPVLKQITLNQMMIAQPGTAGTWGLGHTLFIQGDEGTNVVGHDGGTLPAWGAWIRVNLATGNGAVMMISGGRGGVNQLMHDWVYWETGKVTFNAWRQIVFDWAVMASLVIGVGAIGIVIYSLKFKFKVKV